MIFLHSTICRNALKFLLKSMSVGYKQEKVRLVFRPRDSTDRSVHNTNVQDHTGHTWNVMQTVDQAISHLKQKEIVGLLQPGRAGFGREPVLTTSAWFGL